MRRWAGRLLRASTALAALALVGAVVLGAERVGVAAPGAVDPVAVAVPPSAVTQVCPGPIELPEGAGRGDGEFDPVPVAPIMHVRAVTVGADAGPLRATALGSDLELATVAPGGGTRALTDPGADVVLRAQPGVRAATWVAASTLTSVTAGDLRGLAGATCSAAATDTWLVGGSTRLGSTARLVLVNPGSTPAEVTLAAWGAGGLLDLASDRLLIAPGARQVVVLGGEATGQESLALRLRSTGGGVAAWLQDDALDGFTPAGTDLVVPGRAPATRQAVPGVLVGPHDAEPAPVLRLLAPDQGGTATVTLLGGDGPVTVPGVGTVPVSAGEVVDVSLSGLPTGRYTVVVDADVPVLAATQVARVGRAGELDDAARVDRSWQAATPGGSGAVAVPTIGASTLVVGAVGAEGQSAGTAQATVRMLGADGTVLAEHTLRVDVGTTGAWPVAGLADSPAGVQIVAQDGGVLSWALVVTADQDDGTLVTTLTPTPPPAAAAALTARQDPALGLG